MSFGKGGKLRGEDLAARRFLPGGLWMMFACFGAGTPDDSAYRPWLEQLRALGKFGGAIEPVLRSLPAAGQPPFIAALPRALLANPDGPLGFVGHIDLAWSYSFQELDGGAPRNRTRRFTSLLHHALRRDRIGVAFRELVESAIATDTELATLYGDHARRTGPGGDAMDAAQRTRLGHGCRSRRLRRRAARPRATSFRSRLRLRRIGRRRRRQRTRWRPRYCSYSAERRCRIERCNRRGWIAASSSVSRGCIGPRVGPRSPVPSRVGDRRREDNLREDLQRRTLS
jgi:hypothetical protein